MALPLQLFFRFELVELVSLVGFILVSFFFALAQQTAESVADGAEDSFSFRATFVGFPFELTFTLVEFVSKFSFQLGFIAARHVCLLQDARASQMGYAPKLSLASPFLV